MPAGCPSPFPVYGRGGFLGILNTSQLPPLTVFSAMQLPDSVPGASVRCPPPQPDISQSTGVATEFAIQGDPELQTQARQRKLQCRKDAFAAMVLKVVTIPWPREPRISEDTARHVGRNSLLFVNCWKLVVWILL